MTIKKALVALLMSSTLIIPVGCEKRTDLELNPAKTTYSYERRADVVGFGKLKKLEKNPFNVYCHEFYSTEDGRYILGLGALKYLIDKDGRLLTSGSHRITRNGETIALETGASREFNRVPLCFEDTDFDGYENQFIRQEFYKTPKGLYIKNSSGGKK